MPIVTIERYPHVTVITIPLPNQHYRRLLAPAIDPPEWAKILYMLVERYGRKILTYPVPALELVVERYEVPETVADILYKIAEMRNWFTEKTGIDADKAAETSLDKLRTAVEEAYELYLAFKAAGAF